jgi:hypothetical protein
MLMGTAALASARGKADESEILEVPADRLRQALAELPGVSEPIVRAFIMRRQRLKHDREFAGLRILAQDVSRDGHQLDDFLDKNHVPHRSIDFQSEYGRALCERLHLASRDLPALITASGMPLRRPSLREVARRRAAPAAGARGGEPFIPPAAKRITLARWTIRCSVLNVGLASLAVALCGAETSPASAGSSRQSKPLSPVGTRRRHPSNGPRQKSISSK